MPLNQRLMLINWFVLRQAARKGLGARHEGKGGKAAMMAAALGVGGEVRAHTRVKITQSQLSGTDYRSTADQIVEK